MSLGTFALKLYERDIVELEEAHDVSRGFQDITRHDELDYEIEQELRR